MPVSKDAKVIKEIIKRYGSTIDLKTSPYLIAEIIRQYGPKLGKGGIAADCLPPGGPPPPPGPISLPSKFTPSDVLKLLKGKVDEVNQLSAALEKALKKKPKSK